MAGSVLLSPADMLSPSVDHEVPMDYSSEYADSDKSSLTDDSDEACSIPGSFSPECSQDGVGGDQRYARTLTHTNAHTHHTRRPPNPVPLVPQR